MGAQVVSGFRWVLMGRRDDPRCPNKDPSIAQRPVDSRRLRSVSEYKVWLTPLSPITASESGERHPNPERACGIRWRPMTSTSSTRPRRNQERVTRLAQGAREAWAASLRPVGVRTALATPKCPEPTPSLPGSCNRFAREPTRTESVKRRREYKTGPEARCSASSRRKTQPQTGTAT